MTTKKKSTKKSSKQSLQIRTVAGAQDLEATEVAAKGLEVRQLYRDFEKLSEKYNRTSQSKALAAASPAELAADRAQLDSMVADEYIFVDPFGKVYDKEGMLGQVTTSNVLFDDYKTLEEKLQVFKTTAVSTGVFSMKGVINVKYKKSGVTRRRNISGHYRTTHIFAKRGKGWQVIASHMNREPEKIDTLKKFFSKDWTH